MVRPSTQQTVDRIVGTITVLGLSIAAIRWLAHLSKHRKKKQLPWWWPVIALRRRKDRRTKSQCMGEDGEFQLEQMKARERNVEGSFEHRGSCHCGSVQFSVSMQLLAVNMSSIEIHATFFYHCGMQPASWTTISPINRIPRQNTLSAHPNHRLPTPPPRRRNLHAILLRHW